MKKRIQERRFAIIGAGMVGRSLAAGLAARGLTVAAVGSRRLESARAGAAAGRCAVATTDVAAAARAGDVVALSVPDDAVAEVCEQVAAGEGFGPGDVALHLSGALGSDALAAARACGARVLAFHPIQTFARADGALFEGVTCALEGNADAVELGAALAEALGGRAVVLAPEDKALYHAALCVACNYLVTLADAGAGLLAEAGLGEGALAALLPLLRGAVDNLGRVGLPAALTGPISRGDLATLRAHLDALGARAPALLPLYRAAGLQAIGLALRKGTVDAAQGEAMRRLLSGPG
jgi:predicted short-subunit dehydrogenase-like oxidoreductase (DUF2520 family)